ncbi:MAG: glycosyltransferase, partial [Candidatus Omnitrophota bacterium]
RVDGLTVSNNFLKEKYGGEIIVHARDTGEFDPEKFDRHTVMATENIDPGKKIIMFSGTPRAHKGLDDLTKAVSEIEDPDVVLVVIGISEDWYSQEFDRFARNLLGERYIGLGLQPFNKIPEFLAAADVVVIPQKNNLATVGQIPAKVFDAMAMAKPIISTDVSDMKDILAGCGWVIEPENPEAIADAIRDVLKDPAKAEEMGEKARRKCIEKYSWDVAAETFQKVFGE